MWLKVSNRPCQYSQLSTSFVSIKKDTVRLVFGLLQLQTSIYDPSQCFLTGPGRLVLSESPQSSVNYVTLNTIRQHEQSRKGKTITCGSSSTSAAGTA